MKTLAHISDLHFGREDARVAAALLESVHKASADVVVVSGDLTQRAKKKQFRAARAFLAELPKLPRIVVPGNHDVSTTNLFERVVRPLKRYRRFITDNLSPFYSDDMIAIAGINTVRLLSTKDGRINRAQVTQACHQFSTAPQVAIRIVVTHQPIDVPAEDRKHPTIARAAMAMEGFARCKVDLFLSGHLHAGLTLASSARYKLPGYSAVVAHAGTAISTRTRNAPNAWNLIRLDTDLIEVQQMAWNGKKFAPAHLARYRKQPGGWALAAV
jgi:3',5'-cyclic AMP phosphodiesterase CpdA